jgi:hypothetical protein
MTRDDVDTINDLRSKIEGLMKWAREIGRPRLGTIRGLANQCRIDYSTLYSSLSSNRISIVNSKFDCKSVRLSSRVA